MEDLVLRDLDIGRAGGGVSGVMVRDLGVRGVDPGQTRPRVFLPVNLPGGDGGHRGQRPHRRAGGRGRDLQGLPLGSAGFGQALLQGEQCGLDAFLRHEGVFVSRGVHLLPVPQLLYLGRGVEIELLWSELAGPALDLVEELHWYREDVVGGSGASLFSPGVVVLEGLCRPSVGRSLARHSLTMVRTVAS